MSRGMKARVWAQSERHSICDLFEEVGPRAPTLCEGWSTAQLAAHLVLRERRPDVGLGLILPGSLARRAEKITSRLADKEDFKLLVKRLRSGPPACIRQFDGVMNLVEFAIHHEDVRRGGSMWEVRTGLEDLNELLWNRIVKLARLACRHLVDLDLVITRPSGQKIAVGRGDRRVVMTAEPLELALFLFGRRQDTQVECCGDEGGIQELRMGRLGI